MSYFPIRGQLSYKEKRKDSNRSTGRLDKPACQLWETIHLNHEWKIQFNFYYYHLKKNHFSTKLSVMITRAAQTNM